MVKICKLLFDLCLYYTLSGACMYVFTMSTPALPGIPILLISAFLALRFGRESANNRAKKTALFCALPGIILLLNLSIAQIIQFIPGWLYMIVSVWYGSEFADRREFEAHFGFCSKFLFLLPLCFIVPGRIAGAFAGFSPYLMLYLLTGVFLMRLLREENQGAAGQNAAVLAGVVLIGSVLAVLGVPRLIPVILGFIYNQIIVRIILAIAFVAAYIVGGILGTIEIKEKELTLDLNFDAGEIFGEELMQFTENGKGLPGILKIAGVVLLVAAVSITVYLIVRRMLGSKVSSEHKLSYFIESEKLGRTRTQTKERFLRTKNPRGTIRRCYRKYLREGGNRGYVRTAGDTSLSIFEKFKQAFPENAAWRLRELYIKARYNYQEDISKADADRAIEIWREINNKQTASK